MRNSIRKSRIAKFGVGQSKRNAVNTIVTSKSTTTVSSKSMWYGFWSGGIIDPNFSNKSKYKIVYMSSEHCGQLAH